MNKNCERSERRKNQQFGITEHCLYLFNTYFMSQACMFKHNVDTARKYAYHFRVQILFHIFERFTYLLFLNEYTHMRKCVCLDTRLVLNIAQVYPERLRKSKITRLAE